VNRLTNLSGKNSAKARRLRRDEPPDEDKPPDDLGGLFAGMEEVSPVWRSGPADLPATPVDPQAVWQAAEAQDAARRRAGSRAPDDEEGSEEQSPSAQEGRVLAEHEGEDADLAGPLPATGEMPEVKPPAEERWRTSVPASALHAMARRAAKLASEKSNRRAPDGAPILLRPIRMNPENLLGWDTLDLSKGIAFDFALDPADFETATKLLGAEDGSDQPTTPDRPDTLTLRTQVDLGAGNTFRLLAAPPAEAKMTMHRSLPTVLWLEIKGKDAFAVFLSPAGAWVRFGVPVPEVDLAAWRGCVRQLSARNKRLGLRSPYAEKTTRSDAAAESTDGYPIQTTQEWDAYNRAAAAGMTGTGWTSDPNAGTRTFQAPDLQHFVRVEASPEETALGLGVASLERLTGAQDADCAFVLLYVSHVLTPARMLPSDATAVGWVDLDDIAAKIDPNHLKLRAREREEARARVYEYLMFGARARVYGQRSIPYHDKGTRETIETYVDSPLWSIQGRQRPVQPALAAQWEVPRRVEIALSRDWLRLLTHPKLQQFLPMGELLGSIPPAKAAGAWARVIGLALATNWRQKPGQTMAGELCIPRRELLTRYIPKVAPVEEVLRGKDPGRAVEYWSVALSMLADAQFIARTGEAAPGVAMQKLGANGNALPRQGWADQWLDTPVSLAPGPRMEGAVRDRAKAKMEPTRKPFTALGGRARNRRLAQ
jgi:hypothetical protein